MGYYHETPEDLLFDPTMYDILRLLGECGVCGGLLGRQRRDRAADVPGRVRALGRRQGGAPATEGRRPGDRPSGRSNPNGTDALFSNAGPWVRAYAPGAAVMSTLPPRSRAVSSRSPAPRPTCACASPSTPTTSPARFALWSGTSFAAPLFAGRLAAGLRRHQVDPGPTTTGCQRSPRALAGVDAALTDLTP